MKRFFEPITSAWSGIIGHKLRSFLTILGVVIGVSAVIALMSVGKGTTSRILSSVQSLGANIITVNPSFSTSGGVRGGFGSAQTLTLQDAEAIASDVPNINATAPIQSRSYQAIFGNQNVFARVIGVTTSYADVYTSLVVADGNFIQDYDYQHSARVAILGATVAGTLFPNGEEPVGQNFRLGSYQFQVEGVMAAQGASLSSQDNNIIIPLTTLQQIGGITRNISGDIIISSISIAAVDQNHVNAVESDITALLEQRHNIAPGGTDDFSLSSVQDIINQLSQISSYLSILLGAIAGISLLVGGIGVMNIMLVSVIERTREIGIRKALGARERDIWVQFLIEAVFLTFAGGIIGVGIGFGISAAVSKWLTTTVVTWDIVILAVSVAIGIGIFFGFYPAWQASRMNPIEALRHE
jgi:putative ABC transport system permease protein